MAVGILPYPGKGRTGGRQVVNYTNVKGRTQTAIVTGGTYTTEVQVLTETGTGVGGTFTITFNGQTTTAIAYNATAATIEAALGALSTVGFTAAGASRATCTGGPLNTTPVTVTFSGRLRYTNVPQMTTDSTGLTGTGSPAVTPTTQTGGVSTLNLRVGSGGGGTRLLTGVARRTSLTQTNVWWF